MTSAEIVIHDGALLAPAGDLATIAERFGQYGDLCRLLLAPEDWQVEKVPKPFLKRSGWRKLSTAMGVDLEQRRRHVERDPDGAVLWAEFTYRATAPNGRYADAEASCAYAERKPHAWAHRDHDVIATAETRAKNRAAADLFGLGALSAEEMTQDVEAPAAAVLPAPGGAALDSTGPPWSGELQAFRIACRNLADEVRRTSPGFDPDRLRHDVVASATEGRATSSADLTAADMPWAWAELERAREELTP